MVSEERLYLHLFSKENIWSNPHSCNNNSAYRIISKEEEREDPRRDSSIFFEYSGVSTNTTRTTVFPHAIQQVSSHPVQRNYSTYRINSSSPRNTTTTRLIPCRLLPATAPRAPSNSTRQNPAIRLPTAFQGHTVQAGFQ